MDFNVSDIYQELSESSSLSDCFERSSDDYVPEDSSRASSTAYQDEIDIGHEIGATIEIPAEGNVVEENRDVGISAERNDEGENIEEVRDHPPQIRQRKKHFSPKLKVSRKRQRLPDQWTRNKNHISRERGESYKSYKGVEVPSKLVEEGNICPENCKLRCSQKFDFEQRRNIFRSFYKMDINGKNAILCNTIHGTVPERKRKGAITHKQNTYKYFITLEGKQTLVCKRALMALYQISKKKIEVIQTKMKRKSVTSSPDKRGRHDNRPNKIPDAVKEYVKEHISSFPAEHAHYSRTHNINRKYLSPLLTLPKMHRLYLDLCEGENKPSSYKIKECSYRSIFVNEFNLSFRQPRSDTCSTCDSGKASNEHVENYREAFDAMKADRDLARTSENVVYITIDLQQTMPLPRLTTSKAFYLRQLWFYNFGVHIITKDVDKTVFCTWTENQSSKGSTEIFSSLLTVFEFENVFRNKEHLILWSDSCGGQNKNFLILCLHQYLVRKNFFKIIDHKYPEVGHTYLDSDRAFGRIEKVLRKNETLYSPEQYRDIIVKSGKKNVVIDMRNHFRKTDNLEKEMKLFNRKKDCLKEQVRFRDGIKWFRTDKYGYYMFKECYDYNMPFKQVNINRSMKYDESPNLENIIVERDQNKKNPVTREKIDNLREQLKYIPEEHQWFYRNIIAEHDTHEDQ